MKVISQDVNFGVIELEKSELEAISMILTEVARQIVPWEYEIRIGMKSEDGIKLNDSIKDELKHMREL